MNEINDLKMRIQTLEADYEREQKRREENALHFFYWAFGFVAGAFAGVLFMIVRLFFK